MTKPVHYHHLEVRSGPAKTSVIVVIATDRSVTVLDAGLSGAQARTQVRELGARMRLPIVDRTTPNAEERWGRQDWFKRASA